MFDEALVMKSQNFEFLRAKYPDLASYGGFAEAYAFPDPEGALTKIRSFLHVVVDAIYTKGNIPRPHGASLYELTQESTFRRIVHPAVQAKMHSIRQLGNDAAHARKVLVGQALRSLRDTFDIAEWFHLAFGDGKGADCPAYQAPTGKLLADATLEQLEKEKKAAHDKTSAQEAQLKQLAADLEEERRKRVAAEQLGIQSQEELERTLANASAQAANVLQLDEQTTRRRYVDDALVAAGWNVGEAGKSTEAVGQEVAVAGLRTTSGNGKADYVLWGDNGKPLAVIEVKRASSEMEKGREQAKQYADCLEKKHGVRPLIFYTNGIDIGLWDDVQGLPPRDVHGFYSKDSLEHLVFQRANKVALATVSPRPDIAGRMYQIEAIRRVCERFTNNQRRALVVQATGTGKTRVAVSLCEVLRRADWAKRILFLCDRRELRKQAMGVFNEFLPNEPRVMVSSRMTSEEKTKSRIFFATYPAMMGCYEQFDVGFFDVIVADESHRSIYNRYRDLFVYFDALQVGLTATPIDQIDRNTFALFGCDHGQPTSNFTFKEAIEHKPPYLANFRVLRHTTKFLRQGIKYAEMSEEQRASVDADDVPGDLVDFDAEQVDKQIFNADTTRKIWSELMDHGIRDAVEMRPGKTLVFARNHRHAMHLEDVFHKTYSQYGGSFCRVIDNEEPKADQLIDDLKDAKNDLTVAISVDMLDTGIDIPEIVNLVFAKPVRSKVKFWQMIGRGTRLCEDLFGPGRHKTEFLINDHWGNFEFFSERYKDKDPAPARSLLQNLFEARIGLAEAALEAMDESTFQATVDLLHADLKALDHTQSFAVKQHWQAIERLKSRERLAGFSAAVKADLRILCAPLMKERNIRGDEEAYRFDLVMTLLQTELLRRSPRSADLRARVVEAVELLPKNSTPVKAVKDAIQKVRDKKFWKAATHADTESLRTELRGVMKHQVAVQDRSREPLYLDVADSGVKRDSYIPTFDHLELVAYRRRVEEVIATHLADHPVLQKVKQKRKVTEAELETVTRLILEVDDRANLKHLAANSPDTRNSLLHTLRGIVGLDGEAVDRAFTSFSQAHSLSSHQLRFLTILKNLIAKNGGMEIDRLYEEPFTGLHPDGVTGIFDDKQLDELATILTQFANAPESRNAS